MQWRTTLTEKQRRQLAGPQQNVSPLANRHAEQNGKCPQDLKREAAAAWGRFVACVSAMTSDQARLLWQAALGKARSITMPRQLRQGSG